MSLKPIRGVGILVLALTFYSPFCKSQGVGINESTPVSMLDVKGGVTIGATYSGTNAAPANGVIIEGNVGIGSITPSQKLDVTGNAAISGNINIGSLTMAAGASANEVLITDGSGNGTWQAASAVAVTSITAGTGLTTGGGPGVVTIDAVGGSGLTESANDIDLGGALDQATTITQSTNTMTFSTTTGDFIVDLTGTGDFKVMDGAFTRMKVLDDGNVGIGIANPLKKLHVNGASATIRLDNNSSGLPALALTMPGVELLTGAQNATTIKYGTGLKFMSDDAQFTTENPKFLAGILPRATQGYNADNRSGMAIDFAVTDDDQGPVSLPSVAMTIDGTGMVGIGSESPAFNLDVNGTARFSGNVTIPTGVDVTLTDIPTVGTDAANKTYVDAQIAGVGGCDLTWQGFTTSTYNGDMGGTPGMNSKCNTDFAGSHACSYAEIVALGTSYPWTTADAWVVDGSYVIYNGTNYTQVTVDGGDTQTQTSAVNKCGGWNNTGTTTYAPYVENNAVTTRLVIANCNSTFKIPCCKCQ